MISVEGRPHAGNRYVYILAPGDIPIELCQPLKK